MVSVLHVNNIAGAAGLLSDEQTRLHLKSDVLVFNKSKFNFDYDFLIKEKKIRKVINFWNIAKNYDVLHFHYKSIFKKGRDIILWKKLGKKIIMHHHGSDIRGIGELPVYKKYCDTIFVSTPDLIKWSKDSIWIPVPIYLDNFKDKHEKTKSDVVTIVHAPNNRDIKGTKFVLKAIEKIKNKGYTINFNLVENTSHEILMSYLKNADIVIDQLLLGWYGMLSVEAMAFSKPVCVYIDETLNSYLPFNPLVTTDKQNIYDNLIRLIEDEKLRKEYGSKGKKFITEFHDVKKITKKINSYY
jgi:hypothetical protein